MTINLAGTAIKDVRVAGVQAQRVMLGTGSTAVEVWSADTRSGAQIWMPLDPPALPLLHHAGTLTPAVTSTLQARDGYAYTPAGAGPGASMHYAGTWDTGGTVSMWVRQTGQTTGAHAAFYRASGSHELGLWQQVGAASPYMLFSLTIGGVPIELHAAGASVPNGQWAMVTVTVSRSSGSSSWTVTGYVNGEYAGQVTKTATAQAFGPGSIAFAGTSWGGDVDDLLVWDRALNPDEVQQVWSASDYPPASVYPLTGTWGPLMSADTRVTRASHTITESGTFTITHVGTMPLAGTVNIVTPAGTVTGNPAPPGGGTSTATTTVTLSVGAVVQFQTRGYGTASGTWSITKN